MQAEYHLVFGHKTADDLNSVPLVLT
jgi:hypothetical protein